MKTDRNALACTINHNDEPRRLRLVCRWDGEQYMWYDSEDMSETGVCGTTLADAKRAARSNWASAVWDLRAKW